jgi:hypothetical protein
MPKQIFDFKDARNEIADRAYETYDFGSHDGISVESADGWQSDGSPDITRIVYIDVGEEDTMRVSFHVRFVSADSNDVEDVYALLMSNGGKIGYFPMYIHEFNRTMASA